MRIKNVLNVVVMKEVRKHLIVANGMNQYCVKFPSTNGVRELIEILELNSTFIRYGREVYIIADKDNLIKLNTVNKIYGVEEFGL